MMVIVLTGSIATGKSTVSSYLKNINYPVVDTDIISRQVVEPGQKCLEEIKEAFGEEVLNSDGSLNRPALSDLIFNNEKARIKLNQIMHPRILEETESQVEKLQKRGHEIIFVDIPLYYETNFPLDCDAVWVVYTDPQTQLIRLMKRNNYSEEEALARINSQISIDEKKRLADEVIDNQRDIEKTYRQVDALLDKIVKNNSKML